MARATPKRGRGLPKRKPTTSFFDVRVADDDEYEAAQQELATAQDYVLVRLASDSEMKTRANLLIENAQKRWRACFERIHFQEIDPAIVDGLISEHPFPDDAPVGHQWAYIHHLAAASCVEIDQSPQEWAEWCEGWSSASWDQFMVSVLAPQRRVPTEGLPKG